MFEQALENLGYTAEHIKSLESKRNSQCIMETIINFHQALLDAGLNREQIISLAHMPNSTDRMWAIAQISPFISPNGITIFQIIGPYLHTDFVEELVRGTKQWQPLIALGYSPEQVCDLVVKTKLVVETVLECHRSLTAAGLNHQDIMSLTLMPDGLSKIHAIAELVPHFPLGITLFSLIKNHDLKENFAEDILRKTRLSLPLTRLGYDHEQIKRLVFRPNDLVDLIIALHNSLIEAGLVHEQIVFISEMPDSITKLTMIAKFSIFRVQPFNFNRLNLSTDFVPQLRQIYKDNLHLTYSSLEGLGYSQEDINYLLSPAAPNLAEVVTSYHTLLIRYGFTHKDIMDLVRIENGVSKLETLGIASLYLSNLNIHWNIFFSDIIDKEDFLKPTFFDLILRRCSLIQPLFNCGFNRLQILKLIRCPGVVIESIIKLKDYLIKSGLTREEAFHLATMTEGLPKIFAIATASMFVSASKCSIFNFIDNDLNQEFSADLMHRCRELQSIAPKYQKESERYVYSSIDHRCLVQKTMKLPALYQSLKKLNYTCRQREAMLIIEGGNLKHFAKVVFVKDNNESLLAAKLTPTHITDLVLMNDGLVKLEAISRASSTLVRAQKNVLDVITNLGGDFVPLLDQWCGIYNRQQPSDESVAPVSSRFFSLSVRIPDKNGDLPFEDTVSYKQFKS